VTWHSGASNSNEQITPRYEILLPLRFNDGQAVPEQGPVTNGGSIGTGNCCEYRMPREYDDTTFETDHIIAGSHGGPTRASNLCLACFAWS
jgi:hypothetical protein